MVKKQLKKRISFLLSLFLSVGCFTLVFHAETFFAEPECDSLLSYWCSMAEEASEEALLSQLAASPLSDPSTWVTIALCRYEKTEDIDFSGFLSALKRTGLSTLNATERYRTGVLYLVLGDRETAERILSETDESEGVMSLVWCLILSDGLKKNTDGLIGDILSMETEGGGWTLSGTAADPDVTAMTVQALASHCQSTAVAAAVERSLDLLSARQLSNGGFSSWGNENPETVAQVILALLSLDRDPVTESGFVKNGRTLFDALSEYRTPEGGYAHLRNGKSNLRASFEALLAYVAYDRYQKGSPFLFHFDDLDRDMTEPEEDRNPFEPQPEERANESLPSEPSKSRMEMTGKDLCLIGFSVFSLILVALFLLKRKSLKTVLALILVLSGAFLFLLLSDIRTPSEYYMENKEPILEGDPVFSLAIISPDGELLAEDRYRLHESESVLAALQRICRQQKLSLDAGQGYVKGLCGLYERDRGALSGWLYCVNGERPGISAADFELSDGDSVVWYYSLGEDFS